MSVRYLPTAEFVLNNQWHLAHQMTPFELIYGYQLDFTVPAGLPTKFPALDSRLQHLHKARKEVEVVMRCRHGSRCGCTPSNDFGVTDCQTNGVVMCMLLPPLRLIPLFQ